MVSLLFSYGFNWHVFTARLPVCSRRRPTSRTTTWSRCSSRTRFWTGTTACRRARATTTWTQTTFQPTDDRVRASRSRTSPHIPQASLCMAPSSKCKNTAQPAARQEGRRGGRAAAGGAAMLDPPHKGGPAPPQPGHSMDLWFETLFLKTQKKTRRRTDIPELCDSRRAPPDPPFLTPHPPPCSQTGDQSDGDVWSQRTVKIHIGDLYVCMWSPCYARVKNVLARYP